MSSISITNYQLIKNITATIIVLILIVTGIISIIYRPDLNKKTITNWQLLEAEQASLNTLQIAKEMLQSNLLTQNCLNTAGCPFWSGFHKIRFTDKKGRPNRVWWKKNAYRISNSPNKSRFIVIPMANDLYKIVAFAKDYSNKQAFISSCYYKKEP